MTKGKDVLINAVENAIKKANPTMLNLIKYYLRTNVKSDFSLAYEHPKKFKEILVNLLGEYSTRLLEMIIIKDVIVSLGLSNDFSSLEELVETIKESGE